MFSIRAETSPRTKRVRSFKLFLPGSPGGHKTKLTKKRYIVFDTLYVLFSIPCYFSMRHRSIWRRAGSSATLWIEQLGRGRAWRLSALTNVRWVHEGHHVCPEIYGSFGYFVYEVCILKQSFLKFEVEWRVLQQGS